MGKKIGGAVKGAVGGAAGGVLGSQVGGLFGGGGKDLLFGKSQKPFTMRALPRTEEEKKLSKLKVRAGEAFEKEAMKPIDRKGIKDIGREIDIQERARITGEEKLARGAMEDQKRQLQQQIAARGLGSSAAGLGAATTIGQRFSENLARIRAQKNLIAPQISQAQRAREDALRERRISRIAQLFGSAPLSKESFYQDKPASRSGGLLGAAGGVLGAAYSPQDRAGGFRTGAGAGKLIANV